MKKKSSGLTGKQKAFVTAYLSNGFNATKAAIEAGYAKTGAHVEASRMLRNPKVSQVIAKAFRDRGIAPEAIQMLLSGVAFNADVADFEPWIRGKKSLQKLRSEGVDTRAVKSATDGPRGRRIELHDRLGAAKELGRILGLVTQKHEINDGTRVQRSIEKMTHEHKVRLAQSAIDEMCRILKVDQADNVADQRGINQEGNQPQPGNIPPSPSGSDNFQGRWP